MNVFVSGQIKEKYKIRKILRRLELSGHRVTHDWTRTDNLRKPYKLEAVEAGRRAHKDIRGVLDADIYILMSDNSECGKGMYVELGTALAVAEMNVKKLQVYVVGPMNHESVFYHHPAVVHKESIDEIIELFQESKEMNASDTAA